MVEFCPLNNLFSSLMHAFQFELFLLTSQASIELGTPPSSIGSFGSLAMEPMSHVRDQIPVVVGTSSARCRSRHVGSNSDGLAMTVGNCMPPEPTGVPLFSPIKSNTWSFPAGSWRLASGGKATIPVIRAEWERGCLLKASKRLDSSDRSSRS